MTQQTQTESPQAAKALPSLDPSDQPSVDDTKNPDADFGTTPNPETEPSTPKPRTPKAKGSAKTKPAEEPRLKRSTGRISGHMLPGHVRRSGGPKGEEGKARSSQNSVKHGGYVTPRSDLERLSTIEQGLIKQFHPQTLHQRLQVQELARAHYGLELMGGLMTENLALGAAIPPNAMALSARVEFPWPDHANELIEPPAANVLQRELGQFFLRRLNERQAMSSNSQPNQEGLGAKKLSPNLKLFRGASERLLSPRPLFREEDPGFWRRVDRLMQPRPRNLHGSKPTHRPDLPTSENILEQCSTGFVRIAGPRQPVTAATRRGLLAPTPDRAGQVEAADLAQGREPALRHGLDWERTLVWERALRTYWLFMNYDRVMRERAMMVNERRMGMVTDPNVNRAQAQHMKMIATLELQLKARLDDPLTQLRGHLE